jgi:hypothetical protein
LFLFLLSTEFRLAEHFRDAPISTMPSGQRATMI